MSLSLCGDRLQGRRVEGLLHPIPLGRLPVRVPGLALQVRDPVGGVGCPGRVRERGPEPLQGGDVTARITAPSGKAESIGFVSSGDTWGAYSAQFTAREPGRHQVVLTCKQTGASLEASFFVQGGMSERAGLPARPEVMEEIARVTRGKVMRVDRPEEIVSSLASLPDPAPSVRRVQVWSHPLTAALVIALMGVFWVGRKAIGLI